MNNSVSVIIPFYNNVPWLIEAVESVLQQKYKAKEIIVVNDGSKESLNEFIKLYNDKIVYIFKENEGPASARNLGISISTGDYIAFLDSDDVWLPNKLDVQIKMMQKNNVIWSHTAYELFSEGNAKNEIGKIIDIKNFDGMIYPKMLISNNIATPTVVIEGEFLRENLDLRFNKSMRYGQDQYLWINIALNHELLAINQVHTRVRMRGTNAALRARVQLRARSIIWGILQSNKKVYKVDNIPLLTKIAFIFCNFSTRILQKVEKKINNSFSLEWFSRILYVIPWILFKLQYKANVSRAE